MAMKPLDLTKIIPFESPRDPDFGKPEATKFKLCAIPSRVFAHIKDSTTTYRQKVTEVGESMDVDVNTQSSNRLMTAFGLKGFENYGDLEFKTQKERIGGQLFERVHDDILDAMEPELLGEISAKVHELNTLSEADEKKSEG